MLIKKLDPLSGLGPLSSFIGYFKGGNLYLLCCVLKKTGGRNNARQKKESNEVVRVFNGMRIVRTKVFLMVFVACVFLVFRRSFINKRTNKSFLNLFCILSRYKRGQISNTRKQKSFKIGFLLHFCYKNF